MDLQLLRWKRDVFFVGHTSLGSGSQSRCSHPFFAQRSFGFHSEQFVVSFARTNMGARLSTNSSVNVRVMHLSCLKKLISLLVVVLLWKWICQLRLSDLVSLPRACQLSAFLLGEAREAGMVSPSFFKWCSPWHRANIWTSTFSKWLKASLHTMGTWLWAPWRALLASPNYWLLGLLGLEMLEWGRCQRSDVEILL